MASKEINDFALDATPAGTDEMLVQATGGGTTSKALLSFLLARANHTGEEATADVADAAITLAKQADMAADKIQGRANGAGTGVPQALSATQVRTLINVDDAAADDQTGAEIKTAYENEADTNAFVDADRTKLDAIEAAADVTDATNVAAAGAVMATLFDAQTVLGATADNTPAAITVAEQEIVGRKTGGNVAALTATETRTLLNVEDNADVTDATNVGALVNGLQKMFIAPDVMYGETTAAPAALATAEVVAGQPEVRGFGFDATGDEAVQFTVVMPKRWDAGTIKFIVHCASTHVGTDGVAFALAAVSLGDNDGFATAFGTPIVVTDDAQSGANSNLITALSAAVTVAAAAAGELTVFRLFRDVSDGNDDMAEDAIVTGLEIEWTSNALNDA